MQSKIQALQSKVSNQQRQIQQYQTQQSGIPHQQKSKNRNFPQNRLPYMARGRNQQNRPFCNFCRAVGHRAMYCRKRKMYISGQIQNITCIELVKGWGTIAICATYPTNDKFHKIGLKWTTFHLPTKINNFNNSDHNNTNKDVINLHNNYKYHTQHNHHQLHHKNLMQHFWHLFNSATNHHKATAFTNTTPLNNQFTTTANNTFAYTGKCN